CSSPLLLSEQASLSARKRVRGPAPGPLLVSRTSWVPLPPAYPSGSRGIPSENRVLLTDPWWALEEENTRQPDNGVGLDASDEMTVGCNRCLCRVTRPDTTRHDPTALEKLSGRVGQRTRQGSLALRQRESSG